MPRLTQGSTQPAVGIYPSSQSPIGTDPGVTQRHIQFVTKNPCRVKLPGREAHYSPLSGAEVKIEWSYNLIPPYALIACLGHVYLYVLAD
jgi:hypothetical protein